MKIYGLDLDEAGRCRHYHKACDVVALKCAECGKYYACYQCHDEMEDHTFKATGSCIHCSTAFNPRCKLHYGIYFKD